MPRPDLIRKGSDGRGKLLNSTNPPEIEVTAKFAHLLMSRQSANWIDRAARWTKEPIRSGTSGRYGTLMVPNATACGVGA